MVNAHKAAKEIVGQVGDYMIALSIALKKAWKEIKKGVEKMKVDGKTFKFLEDKMVMATEQVEIEFDPKKVTDINDETWSIQVRNNAKKGGNKYFVVAKLGRQTAVIGIPEEVKQEIDKQYPKEEVKIEIKKATHYDRVMASLRAEDNGMYGFENEGEF